MVKDFRRAIQKTMPVDYRKDIDAPLMPRKAGPAPTASADPAAVNVAPGVHVDGLEKLREARHHVRELKREVADIGTAHIGVTHHGFGHHGGHAPGAVRTALNGGFVSDGRAWG